MIGSEIENTGNNCGEADRNSERYPLCFGKPPESRSAAPQSDDQPDDNANDETERRQRKKDQHPAPTFEIRNVIELGQIKRRHDRENRARNRREKRDHDNAQRSHSRSMPAKRTK